MKTLRPLCAPLFLLAILGLAGCGGRVGQAADTWKDPHPLPADTMQYGYGDVGRHGGRYVVAATNGPRTFNPVMGNEQSSNDVNNLMWASLLDFDYVSQGVISSLAKSWEMSPDSVVYTFHLRRGIRFTDGVPITSADVLFSAEVALDKDLHPSVQDLMVVDGKPFEFSAPDSQTVVVRVPRPMFNATWAMASLRILPRHRLEAAYRAGTFASADNVSIDPDSLVTSGPFTLKQYVPGEKTELKRNPYWFRVDARGKRLPYLDEIVFLIVPDQNTAALKFQSGEVDGVDSVKPEDYKAYEDQQKQGHFTLYDVGPSLTTNFIWFNLNTVKAPRRGKRIGDPAGDPVKYSWFRQVEFRKAVSKAIDRDDIIRGPFFGQAVKNWSTVTAGNRAWYSPSFTGDDFDTTGARKLLRSIGMEDRDGDGVIEDPEGHPVRFSMVYNADNEVRQNMATMVREDLARVGIDLTLVPAQFNAILGMINDDFNYDAAMLGLGAGIPPDPSQSVNVFRSSGRTHFWNVKQKRPGTPEEARLDSMATIVATSFDEARRHRTYADIVRLMNSQDWFIWLPTQILRLPVRDRLGNAQPQVITHRLLWNAERVYVKRPDQAS